MPKIYRVRFTARENGKSHVAFYSTARQAKKIVALTYTRHAEAETDAEYIGVANFPLNYGN